MGRIQRKQVLYSVYLNNLLHSSVPWPVLNPYNGKINALQLLSSKLRNIPGAYPVHSPHVTAGIPYSGKMSDSMG